jgi:RNA polymerase sigma factor (sigma-70 family)
MKKPTVERLPITPEQADRLETLWLEHSRPVYQAILGFTRNATDAADVLSLTFQRLAGRLDDLPAGGALRGFLITMARNLAIDTQRQDTARQARHDEIADGATGQCPVYQPPPGDADLRAAIVHALASLPGDQRRAVEGRLIRGLAFEELARQEGTSLKTVASRFSYGLKKIREQLRPYYDCITTAPMKTSAQPNDENQPLIRALDPKRLPSTVPGLDGLAAIMPPDFADDTEEAPAEDFAEEDLGDYVAEEDIEAPEEIIDYVVTSEEVPVEFNELFVFETTGEETVEETDGTYGEYDGEVVDGETGEEGPIDPRILYMTGMPGGEGTTGSGDPSWAFRGGEEGEAAPTAGPAAVAEAPVEELAPVAAEVFDETPSEITLTEAESADWPNAALAELETTAMPVVETVTAAPETIALAELETSDSSDLAALSTIEIEAEANTAVTATDSFLPTAEESARPELLASVPAAEAAPLPAAPAAVTVSHGPAAATVLGAAVAAGTVLQSRLPSKKRRA